MRYITVMEAATICRVTKQAVYKVIWSRTLKSKKINGKTYTSVEWLEDFRDHLRSKQEHSMFNGEKVFQPQNGELSIDMIAKSLNIPRYIIADMVKAGKIQHYRKKMYVVIPESEVQKIKQLIEARKMA